jgi:hypothetical protein
MIFKGVKSEHDGQKGEALNVMTSDWGRSEWAPSSALGVPLRIAVGNALEL